MSLDRKIDPNPVSSAGNQIQLRWTHPRPETPVLTHQKNAFAAEQYRSLAIQLEQRLAKEAVRNPAVVVTSADPGSGKTLNSLNLAISLARGGKKRILLIEGDLWKPSLSRYLQRDPDAQGLGHVLAGETPVSRAVVTVWKAGVDVVFAGNHRDGVGLVTLKSVGGLIERLRRSYDLILIDSPPVVLSIGRTLADCADLAIVIVRARKSVKKRIEEALSILGSEKVIGLVLNDVGTRALRYGSYGGYASYSSYEAYEAYEKKTPSPEDSVTPELSPAPSKKRGLLATTLAVLLAFAAGLGLRGTWTGKKPATDSVADTTLAPEGPEAGLQEPTIATLEAEEAAVMPIAGPVTPTAGDAAQASTTPLSNPTSNPEAGPAGPPPATPILSEVGPEGRPALIAVRLNLRAAPGLDQPVLKLLLPGTETEITDRQDNWYRVRGTEIDGWVHSSGVSFSERPDNLAGSNDAAQASTTPSSTPASNPDAGPAGPPPATPTLSEDGPQGRPALIAVGLNLRAAPGLDQPILKLLLPGTETEITDRQDNWYRVRGTEIDGWVHSSGVSFSERPDNLAGSNDSLAPPILEKVDLVAESPPPRQTAVTASGPKPEQATPSSVAVAETPTILEAAPPEPAILEPEEAEANAEDPVARLEQGGSVPESEPSAIVIPPTLISLEQPAYPPAAHRRRLEGTVTVSVLVDETGRVVDATVVNPVRRLAFLNRAASEAARTARFRPATQSGTAVQSTFQLVFPFVLRYPGGSNP